MKKRNTVENERISIKKNALMNMALSVSNFVFPLITFPYASRILLPTGMGKVSFAISFVTYFNMFAQLGIPTYGIRACAKIRDDQEKLNKVCKELLLINLFMSFLAYLILGLCIVFVPRIAKERTLFIVTSVSIFLNAIGIEWLYKGLEQYRYITIRSLIFKFIAVVSTFLLIKVESDYIIYGGISIFASAASNICNFFYAQKYVDFWHVEQIDLKQHLRPVLVFFVMACAVTIYTNLDAVMLGFLKTDADVGYYNSAVKIKNVLVSMVTALGVVLLPRSSYYVENGQMEEFYQLTKKAFKVVFLISVPVVAYFILYARESILLLSGSAFEEAILPMQIIMPTVLFIGLTNVLGIQILVPLGKEKIVLISEAAAAITDLTLNAVLIPVYGTSGTAVANLFTEAVVLVIQYISLRKEMKNEIINLPWFRIMFGLLAGFAACIGLKTLEMGNLVSLIVSSLTFFGLYGFIVIWKKTDEVRELLDLDNK